MEGADQPERIIMTKRGELTQTMVTMVEDTKEKPPEEVDKKDWDHGHDGDSKVISLALTLYGIRRRRHEMS